MSFQDISAKVFGKYQHCTAYEGVFYADSDFGQDGRPKAGAIPSPSEGDRTPFGQKRKPLIETDAQKEARRHRERMETNALLEQLAEEASPAVGAAQEALADRYDAEYDADVEGFHFECRRFGDFLTIYIARSGSKFSTALNIAATRTIHVAEGHAPDRLGETGFQARLMDSNGSSSWGTGMGNYPAMAGWKYEVSPDAPWLPDRRPLFRLDEPSPHREGGGIMMDNEVYQIRHRVPGTARPAEDDKVRFEGIGATIYCPAGKGAEVWRAILSETERPA